MVKKILKIFIFFTFILISSCYSVNSVYKKVSVVSEVK